MDLFDFLISRWYFSVPLIVTLISWWVYESNKGGKKITPAEAVLLTNRGEAKFLDIRKKEDFETGHISGSLNILKDAFKLQEHLLKKEKGLIVVSENGIDSGGAGVELKKLGIENVYLLKHGLLSWQEESLPLVK